MYVSYWNSSNILTHPGNKSIVSLQRYYLSNRLECHDIFLSSMMFDLNCLTNDFHMMLHPGLNLTIKLMLDDQSWQ